MARTFRNQGVWRIHMPEFPRPQFINCGSKSSLRTVQQLKGGVTKKLEKIKFLKAQLSTKQPKTKYIMIPWCFWLHSTMMDLWTCYNLGSKHTTPALCNVHDVTHVTPKMLFETPEFIFKAAVCCELQKIFVWGFCFVFFLYPNLVEIPWLTESKCNSCVL